MEIEAIAMASAALAAQGFFGEGGRASWAGIGRVIAAIRSRLTGSHIGQSALAAVEENPEDLSSQRELGHQIMTFMTEDAAFREHMENLIREAHQAGAITMTKNMNDYRGATIDKIVNVETVNGDLNF
ncbi:hypothetical protein [Streptomyces sp. MA15]|uniref:hypothetical protein n=1 Tax=Streptomyces TaxID=1883 RepID=UPI0025B1001A|nr:hypothetical protein [Streptomyces sp. MA15]MDN3266519.1 hypothetical protein [Streptomyces sp. MA15]